MEERYDVVVVGGGFGGYNAAIRAAQLRGNVALVEMGRLGGTCLHAGCIPTKALYESAALLGTMQRSLDFGIALEGKPELDFPRLMDRKNAIVDQLTKGIEFLLSKHKIKVYCGRANLLEARTLQIENGGQRVQVEGGRLIIATGSVWSRVPGLEPDGRYILTSDDVLALQTLPESVVIVGGGVIGCEFATLFSLFGSAVTIVELLERILSTEDDDTISAVRRAFRKRGVEVHTGVSVQEAQEKTSGPGRMQLTLSDNKRLEADAVVVAAGRAPNIGGLGLQEVGIELTSQGAVKVDDRMCTNIEGVYAVGDVTGAPMLAHVASREGLVAGSNAMGHSMQMDYEAVPMVTFTVPQIASVGVSERSLKASERTDYSVGKALYKASGMAHCMGETEGFVKIIVDRATRTVLGATLVGSDASNLVAGVVPLIGQPVESITAAIYAHPTLAEMIWEAASEAA